MARNAVTLSSISLRCYHSRTHCVTGWESADVAVCKETAGRLGHQPIRMVETIVAPMFSNVKLSHSLAMVCLLFIFV